MKYQIISKYIFNKIFSQKKEFHIFNKYRKLIINIYFFNKKILKQLYINKIIFKELYIELLRQNIAIFSLFLNKYGIIAIILLSFGIFISFTNFFIGSFFMLASASSICFAANHK